MRPPTIATHDGKFHVDEVLAIALLTMTRHFKIVRSRDINILAEADIRIDVGGKYDISTGDFDHHQFDYDDQNYGLSSAGLVYKTLPDHVEVVSILVETVDRHDTGLEQAFDHPFISIISGLNDPDDIYGMSQNNNFQVAVDYAKSVIIGLTDTTTAINLNATNKLRKEELKRLVSDCIKKYPPVTMSYGRLVVYPKGEIHISTKVLIDLADIVVSWDTKDNAWIIRTVPKSKDSFESDFRLTPTEDHLEIFCHKAGFIGKYRSENGYIQIFLNTVLTAISVPV